MDDIPGTKMSVDSQLVKYTEKYESNRDAEGAMQCNLNCNTNDDVESPAFKTSDMFLFRNAFELDEKETLERRESTADTRNKNSFREKKNLPTDKAMKDQEFHIKNERGVTLQKKSKKHMSEANNEAMNFNSSPPSTFNDEFFSSLDDLHFYYDKSKKHKLSSSFNVQKNRSRSLSDNLNLISNSNIIPLVKFTKINTSPLGSPNSPSSPSKISKFRTLTLGRQIWTAGKKNISFRRSLSESDKKWNRHERSRSLKDRLFRSKGETSFLDGSFFKKFLRNKKQDFSTCNNDSDEDAASHFRLQKETDKSFEQSSPASSRNRKANSELYLWKSETSNEKRNEEILKDKPRDDGIRKEDSIKIWIQEVKGIPDKRSYYCSLLVNDKKERETTIKSKDGICFWGEMFEIYCLQEVKKIGIHLLREDNKSIGKCEFEPTPSIQNDKLDEWMKVTRDKISKKPDREDAAIRIRYTFRKIVILPLMEYKRFTKYLKDNSLSLCKCLESRVNAKAKEDFVTSLINILQFYNKAVSFINQLITSDVNKTGNSDKTLFRANSMATKAIEVYMRLVGNSYLKATLLSPIIQIIQSTKNLEVDCSRIQDEAPALDERQNNLLEAVETVWENIIKSPHYFPAEIHEVFFAVRETLQNSERVDRLISASVFLRFLCPATMTPHMFDLIKEYPGPDVNRKLTLIAKTLQTLANFTSFQQKEECMQFLNVFIEREIENCRKFLLNISGPRSIDMCQEVFQQDINVGRHLAILHMQLRYLLSTFETEVSELKPLITQLNHIDDCLLRYERGQETQKGCGTRSPVHAAISLPCRRKSENQEEEFYESSYM